ncbi:MAG: hypothetical protein WAQ98_15625 [Blastocatellia bacterium]
MTEKNVEKGIYKNNNLAEPEILDDEFIKVLKRASRPRLPKKAPDWVKKNVINNYKKQHKYLIFWYNIKVKFTEYKETLFGSGWGLEIALASMVVLFILSGIVYYQYTKPQTDPTKTIANKEIPKTEKPLITNSTDTSGDVKAPKDEPKVLTVEENKVDFNKNKKNEDTLNSNKLEREKDSLATNLIKPNLGNLRAAKPKHLSTVNQSIQLASVKTIYFGNLISVQEDREWILKFSEELKVEIKSHLDWNAEEQTQTASNADATFKLENSKLVLKDKQHKILWVSKFKLDPNIDDPRDLASKIVSELSKKIKNNSKSSFIKKPDSLE